ncbi:Phenylalanyl-tRNA synthetase beta chain [hydrothermal vent metagenome]|uniref:Phenylalanine--tRNA ligase beta subunit n=1 Tax=hydrothermal vent metagenome TaxID=652676 RepID=A0A3B1A147_9ZZZZ
MKFSEQWLREWVNPKITTEELSHQLTMAGLEVDSIDPVAGVFSKVVVAEVLEVTPHPDADKLRVCSVNIGTDEPLSIVCGAANVAQGAKVPAALIGAILPGGTKIKKGKLRGIASHGMLCSETELGIADEADGLMLLPNDAPVGESIRDYLNLDDMTFDVDLTPNRGDCLSLQGIAREVGVLNSLNVTKVNTKKITAMHKDLLNVTIKAQQACPHYSCLIIKNINAQAKTPLWMVEKLRRSGLRSISSVVDVTNYVLLELGQPMHAFDLDKLNSEIIVRYATNKESLTLLDGQKIKLNTKDLVIADKKVPLALAGIMGGESSAVTDTTQNIFLESAYFDPIKIAGRARSHGLHTESSHRFERGVASNLQNQALQRAVELLLDIVGGESGSIIETSSVEFLNQQKIIEFRPKRFKRVIGLGLELAQMKEILVRLEMKVDDSNSESWQITPPEFRFDINYEEDLLEELSRVYGYEKLPARLLKGSLTLPQSSESNRSIQDYRTDLVAQGYSEAITYSFVDEELQKLLEPELSSIKLANPISEDMAVMRTTLWTGLVQAVQYNLHRQQSRIKLFEYGLKFVMQAAELQQIESFAGVVVGSQMDEQWAEKLNDVDFYDVKGDVERLLERAGIAQDFTYESSTHFALHPGQTAQIKRDGKHCGWIGAIHPALQKKLGFTKNVFLFELEFWSIKDGKIPKFEVLSKFPSIRRDIAIVVDENVPAALVMQSIKNSQVTYLTNVELFDVYTAEGIDSGRKSLALGLTLQDLSRTLTDSEVEVIVTEVLKHLKQNFGAVLR